MVADPTIAARPSASRRSSAARVKANPGTSLAVDPLTGAVYVAWRNFDGPDAIYISKSTDGGKKWRKPIRVANFIPYDQGSTGASFRTVAFPTIAVSVVKNGQSRVHVAWTQRKVAPADAAATHARRPIRPTATRAS